MRLIPTTIALFALCSTLLLAQQRGAPPPAPPANPAAPAPAGQRGGGRGRGAIQAMTLTSTAWPDGSTIPAQYTQAGDDMSPPLAWSGAPDGIVSYVLVMHDLDAPIGNGADDLLHWMLWNIPASARGVGEGQPQGNQWPDGTRQISATGPYFRGPGAAAAGSPHHYVFELYALDSMVDVPAVGQSPAQTRAAVMTAMAGHIRGKGAYVGLFKR